MVTASYVQIEAWLAEGVKLGARWVLIGCDDFNNDDFPVYVAPTDDPHERWIEITDNGDRVHEGYDLELDLTAQLAERRAWHLPAAE